MSNKSLTERIVSNFWSEVFWLPPNITWEDVTPSSDKSINYCNPKDFFIVFPLAACLLAFRFLLERHIFAPLGVFVGIENVKRKKAANISELEIEYLKSFKLDHNHVFSLAKKLDLSERQIERWWRTRDKQNKPTKIVKFCEEFWRFFFYTSIMVFGFVIVWNEDWTNSKDQLFIGYPHQGYSNSMWHFHIIQISYYAALLISQFFDVKRKDFWQMFVHHIITIMLNIFIPLINMYRLGLITIILHDISDIFLGAAKLTLYANYKKMANVIFLLFIIIWVISRLIMFPHFIIWGLFSRAPLYFPTFPAIQFLILSFLLLMVLHIKWTYMIFLVLIRSITSKRLKGDIRSSDSNVSDD